jgi:hypothetical protein
MFLCISGRASSIVLKVTHPVSSFFLFIVAFISFQVVTPPFLAHHPPIHPHVGIEQASPLSVAALRPILAVQTAFPIRLFHIAHYYFSFRMLL